MVHYPAIISLMEEAVIIQDTDKAISVMYEVANWMKDKGMSLSQWWQPQNMNRAFLLQHAEPNEFYAVMVADQSAGSVILQETERNQSWQPIDGDMPEKALYLHWLCVARNFAGQGIPKIIVDFATSEARKRGFKLLRLDTNAKEEKLCKLYEDLGFHLMGMEQEKNHQTAFYQKKLD